MATYPECDFPIATPPEIRRLIKLKPGKKFFSTGPKLPTLTKPSLEQELRQSLGNEAVVQLRQKVQKLNLSLQQQVEAIKHGQKME